MLRIPGTMQEKLAAAAQAKTLDGVEVRLERPLFMVWIHVHPKFRSTCRHPLLLFRRALEPPGGPSRFRRRTSCAARGFLRTGSRDLRRFAAPRAPSPRSRSIPGAHRTRFRSSGVRRVDPRFPWREGRWLAFGFHPAGRMRVAARRCAPCPLAGLRLRRGLSGKSPCAVPAGAPFLAGRPGNPSRSPIPLVGRRSGGGGAFLCLGGGLRVAPRASPGSRGPPGQPSLRRRGLRGTARIREPGPGRAVDAERSRRPDHEGPPRRCLERPLPSTTRFDPRSPRARERILSGLAARRPAEKSTH
jgi:hypothetical protein